ncbi:hypothetical protein [Paenibacillus illinoisensis]|uniref:hypothetical protein n=1 Tax=Paenibacillus illinoisensis TaxID=59845 RepID=UPI003D2C33D8
MAIKGDKVMSFVSVVVCEDFLSVVADGRATNTIVGKIDSEYEQKIHKIGENVFYSNTGFVDPSVEFILNSNLKNSIVTNGVLSDESDIRSWYEEVKVLIKKNLFFEIRFGGLSVNNKFEVYLINSVENDIQKLNYKKGTIAYSLASSDNLMKKISEEYFVKKYTELRVENLSIVRGIQESLNDYVAEKDETVNKNKTYFSLEKPRFIR